MYVGDYLGRRALYTPDQLAVVDAGKTPHRTFTYSELNNRANRLANWLRDGAGIGKGDRVAVLAYNGVEYLDTFFACGKLGAILVGAELAAALARTAQLIEKTTPKVLIYSDEFAEADSPDHRQQETHVIQHLLHIEGKGHPQQPLLREDPQRLGAAPGDDRRCARGRHRLPDLHGRHDRACRKPPRSATA